MSPGREAISVQIAKSVKEKNNNKKPTNQTNWAHFKTQCLTAWVINNFKIVLKWYKLKYKTLTKVINIRHKIKIAILTCYGPVSVGFFEWWLTIPWLENFTWFTIIYLQHICYLLRVSLDKTPFNLVGWAEFPAALSFIYPLIVPLKLVCKTTLCRPNSWTFGAKASLFKQNSCGFFWNHFTFELHVSTDVHGEELYYHSALPAILDLSQPHAVTNIQVGLEDQWGDLSSFPQWSSSMLYNILDEQPGETISATTFSKVHISPSGLNIHVAHKGLYVRPLESIHPSIHPGERQNSNTVQYGWVWSILGISESICCNQFALHLLFHCELDHRVLCIHVFGEVLDFVFMMTRVSSTYLRIWVGWGLKPWHIVQSLLLCSLNCCFLSIPGEISRVGFNKLRTPILNLCRGNFCFLAL